MSEALIGRQPIYDRRLGVVGYELLFRRAGEGQAVVDGNQATSQVIVNTFIEIGLDVLVGEHLAFINFTADLLLASDRLTLPPDRVVIEVLEDVEARPEIVDRLQALAARGYTIALDDVVAYDAALEPLLDVAQVVKVDVLATDRARLPGLVDRLRRRGRRLIAEKVETQQDFDALRALGFDYFQGYFFARPDLVRQHRSPGNRAALLFLLAKLQDREVDFRELERIIAWDVTLSYKLLRFINSAYYALPSRVDSIRQAIALLGTRTVATWVTLLVMAGVDDKPRELMTTALVRATMCERLGRARGADDPDRFFMVGLLSVLDALLDQPMAAIVASLPLADDVAGALVAREGSLGEALVSTLAYERGQWERLDARAFPPGLLRQAFLDGIALAAEVRRQFLVALPASG